MCQGSIKHIYNYHTNQEIVLNYGKMRFLILFVAISSVAGTKHNGKFLFLFKEAWQMAENKRIFLNTLCLITFLYFLKKGH